MKKMITLFLLVSLSYLSALATIDLQPNNVSYSAENGLMLTIQNNGSEDFDGSFNVYLATGNIPITTRFSGLIRSSQSICMQLSNQKIGNHVLVDSNNEIAESNEANNDNYFDVDDSQVRLLSSWGMIANGYRDTLFVLPGEYFYEQFSLQDMSHKESIIGINLRSDAYGFSRSQGFRFDVQSFYPYTSGSGDLYNGKYEYQMGYGEYSSQTNYWGMRNATCQWMANASSAATNQFWLGSFYGTNKESEVGSVESIYIYCSFILNNLEEKYGSVARAIKTIDRIRGDINDDGFVTEEDLNIINTAVNNGWYNPCVSFKNMYVEKGINYGAGIILFNVPDFISVILLNIWLHDKNDPLVQGYGIGELMSKTPATSPAQQIANSFSVVGNNLNIVAPEANLYNVTAQVDDKFFQVTGEIGEQITIPTGATNIQVETIKMPQITTALRNILKEGKAEAYFGGNFLNIRAADKEKVTVVNLSGQIMISTLPNSEESQIDASNWPKGMYLIKIGNKTTKVIK